jgi:hypothetical protein
MSATATLRQPNNHFTEKGYGNNTYKGPLENLPRPETFDLESSIEMMHTDGYCIIPNVLNRDEVKELRHLMDTSGGPDEQYNVKNWCFNKHLTTNYHQDPRLLKYAALPGVTEVMDSIHNGARINGGSFWITGAGREMGIHVDWLPMDHMPEEYLLDPRVRVPIFKSTAHIYLNDLVPELGPTLLIPGSHKSGRAPKDEPTWRGTNPKAVMLKAGDVAIFRTEVWHGAWRNTCQTEKRYMMQIFYGTPWMASGIPPINQSALWNPECLKAITKEQRRAFGG